MTSASGLEAPLLSIWPRPSARARRARPRLPPRERTRACRTHGRQVQRARPALAEDLQGRVQVRLVGEAPRVDLVVIEGGVVAHHGQIVVDAGGDVGVVRRGQGGARQRLEVHDVEHLVGGGERRLARAGKAPRVVAAVPAPRARLRQNGRAARAPTKARRDSGSLLNQGLPFKAAASAVAAGRTPAATLTRGSVP